MAMEVALMAPHARVHYYIHFRLEGWNVTWDTTLTNAFWSNVWIYMSYLMQKL